MRKLASEHERRDDRGVSVLGGRTNEPENTTRSDAVVLSIEPIFVYVVPSSVAVPTTSLPDQEPSRLILSPGAHAPDKQVSHAEEMPVSVEPAKVNPRSP
jgi:hypothetical protein